MLIAQSVFDNFKDKLSTLSYLPKGTVLFTEYDTRLSNGDVRREFTLNEDIKGIKDIECQNHRIHLDLDAFLTELTIEFGRIKDILDDNRNNNDDNKIVSVTKTNYTLGRLQGWVDSQVGYCDPNNNEFTFRTYSVKLPDKHLFNDSYKIVFRTKPIVPDIKLQWLTGMLNDYVVFAVKEKSDAQAASDIQKALESPRTVLTLSRGDFADELVAIIKPFAC